MVGCKAFLCFIHYHILLLFKNILKRKNSSNRSSVFSVQFGNSGDKTTNSTCSLLKSNWNCKTSAVAADLAPHQSILNLTPCLFIGFVFWVFFNLSSPTTNLKETVLDALIDPILFLPQFVSIISPFQLSLAKGIRNKTFLSHTLQTTATALYCFCLKINICCSINCFRTKIKLKKKKSKSKCVFTIFRRVTGNDAANSNENFTCNTNPLGILCNMSKILVFLKTIYSCTAVHTKFTYLGFALLCISAHTWNTENNSVLH